MPNIVAIKRDRDAIRVFFDGPVFLERYCDEDGGFTRKGRERIDWPDGATHFWYSEAGHPEYDPNGFTHDELGAFLWAEWVLSMQDEWSKKNA